jgi:hypothetical protein
LQTDLECGIILNDTQCVSALEEACTFVYATVGEGRCEVKCELIDTQTECISSRVLDCFWFSNNTCVNRVCVFVFFLSESIIFSLFPSLLLLILFFLYYGRL